MYAKIWKRVIDFIVSLTAFIVLLPLLAVLTVTGAIAMKGNPFFVQKRPGMKDKKTGEEKIISLLKFRTMTNEKDENGELLPDEKRLNAYGRFLRATSCDELPSLLNIIVGDLAIVGPRPLLVKYLPLYTEEQRHRHDVRPGLTGYAQAHGRNAVTWEKRFEMDVWYTKNVRFRIDLSIIAETVRAVLKHDGITSGTAATMEEFTGSGEKEMIQEAAE